MWGVKLRKDSWTGMKGHLIKNISDIAFGTFFFLDTELCDVSECTVPYFENYFLWHLPRAKEVAKVGKSVLGVRTDYVANLRRSVRGSCSSTLANGT